MLARQQSLENAASVVTNEAKVEQDAEEPLDDHEWTEKAFRIGFFAGMPIDTWYKYHCNRPLGVSARRFCSGKWLPFLLFCRCHVMTFLAPHEHAKLGLSSPHLLRIANHPSAWPRKIDLRRFFDKITDQVVNSLFSPAWFAAPSKKRMMDIKNTKIAILASSSLLDTFNGHGLTHLNLSYCSM